jgi:radical SAM protein with 4Fe4S-binding SPASM domain
MIAALPSPVRVSLDVTSACDLHCRHCRHGSREGPEVQLTFPEIRHVVEDAARMGVFRLALSGGEPTLRDDLIEILLHALGSRIGRVFLSTNGRHLAQHDWSPLRIFRNRLTFKISLDGPPGVHDRLRGCAGAGLAAQQAIATLVTMGFDVQVTTTLMRENLQGIEELLAWTAQAGCSRHNFVEVVPIGRAAPDMVLTAEQRRRARQAIHRAAHKYQRRGHSVMAKLPFTGAAPGGLRCTGGAEECGILADGSIVGCRLMPDIVEGNVRDSSLREIWSAPDTFGLFRRLVPGRLSTPCRTCEHGASCLGGCHAFARVLTGDFFGPDTRCPRVTATASTGKETPCWDQP